MLYSFSGAPDGAFPVASLLDVMGTIYGTTEVGGTYLNYGTVFGTSTTGTEHVLHSFGHGSDGRYPEAGLIDANGSLYGTTLEGGTSNGGTAFVLNP